MKKDKLLKYLNDNNLDALIFSVPKNIEYITGFECDPHERLLLYVFTNSNEYLLIPALEEEKAKNILDKNIILCPYLDTENGYEKLENLSGKFKNIGIEKEHITVSRYELLRNIFNFDINLDISFLIRDMRKYKDEEEIKFMLKAANYADKCIEIAKKNLKLGISELELKDIIEASIKKEGINKMSFETIVLFGENAANPHGVSSDRRLKNNEYVLLDLGCYYKGYASDITRCLAFGNPNEFDKNIYDIVLKANTEAIKAVRPGISFASLDKIARDIIEKEGYGKYFNHRLGHGLGMDTHEYPDVSQNTTDLLEEGMTFTIEPGIYIPGKVGIRIEDDILVTKDSYISLTKYEK